MIGQTLSHYEILEKLGSGGMGDVYLAEDAELNRKVALKVLPPELAENEQRRARFKREAQAIAALNHPNIVTVHSVEESDGVHFITMELVRGKTLSELLPRQGFALVAFFDMAIPLADAVAAAHAQGIVHRDLKPGNVMVTDEGRLKVLDFGLAKATGAFAPSEADSHLPTAAKTEEGVIVGTVSYMSPEQAQGKTVDARSDIFSLGTVFYEMLTGRRPFEGETPAEVLSSIIKDDPPAVTGVPREVSRIVRRCLAQDPERRAQSALDIRNELEELRRELNSGELFADASPGRPRRSRGIWALAAGVAAIAVFAIVRLVSTDRVSDRVPRLENPVQVTSAAGVENFPTFSPDGGRIAYDSEQSGSVDIWVTQVAGGAAVNLTADHEGYDREPAWSPDGNQIAFVSEREGRGVYVMPAIGGRASRISPRAATADYISPRWSPDGAELAYLLIENESIPFIEIVSLSNRESRRIPIPDAVGYHWDLSWSPDGRFFAYVRAAGRPFDAGVSRVWVLRASERDAFSITDGMTVDWNPMWSKDGRTLYFLSSRGGSMDLWQQRIADDGEPEGDVEAVTAGIGIQQAALTPDARKLAYSRGRRIANVWRVPIVEDREVGWSDAEQLTFDQAFFRSVDLSPDGERLIVDSDRGGNHDIWILPLNGGEMTQVTTDRAPDRTPHFSPDGQRVVFSSYRSGDWEVWTMPLDGGPAAPLTESPGPDLWPDWSPDGQNILFYSARTGNVDVFVMPAGGGEARQLTSEPSAEYLPRWSPDGEQIVVLSNRDDGVFRLWRMSAEGRPAELLTKGPTWFHRWSPDGGRIYFQKFDSPDLWVLDGAERRVAGFSDRKGRLGQFALAVSDDHIYFTWENDLGDIWVMDVVEPES